MQDKLEELKRAIRAMGAVKFDGFTLASGKTSNVYVDGRLVTLTSAGAGLLGDLLWDRMRGLAPDAIGGMVIGADPIVGAILATAGRRGDTVAGFLVRKEPKGHGTKKCVEGPRPDKEHPRVIVLDDTMTTGGSTLEAARRVREEWGAQVVGAFCIVDREEGARETFAKQGIELQRLLTLEDLRP